MLSLQNRNFMQSFNGIFKCSFLSNLLCIVRIAMVSNFKQLCFATLLLNIYFYPTCVPSFLPTTPHGLQCHNCEEKNVSLRLNTYVRIYFSSAELYILPANVTTGKSPIGKSSTSTWLKTESSEAILQQYGRIIKKNSISFRSNL